MATIASLCLFLLPSATEGHLTRTVGPYTILVVLVEEPVFQDNHAGFEFWVRDAGTPIKGLERTLQAEAVGKGAAVNLRITPLDASGFYVLDRTLQGAPFDPKGGGAWSLVLRGTIDRTKVDLLFPVLFPGYPRVSTTTSDGASGGAAADQGGPVVPVLIIAAASALVALGGVTAWQLRRGRRSRLGAT
jgi:hypothetical protein